MVTVFPTKYGLYFRDDKDPLRSIITKIVPVSHCIVYIIKMSKILRREVLLPGEFLPDAPLGRHHGVVSRVEQMQNGQQLVHITLSDFGRKTKKIQLPFDKIQSHILPKAEKAHDRGGRPPPACPAKRLAATSPPKPKKKTPMKITPGLPVHGPTLIFHCQRLNVATLSPSFPPGTKVWCKIPGHVKWPGILWSLSLSRGDIGSLILSAPKPQNEKTEIAPRPGPASSHPPPPVVPLGTVLFRFYGQHSMAWIHQDKLERPSKEEEEELSKQLRSWGKSGNNVHLVNLTLDEMSGARESPAEEVSRMTEIYDSYLSQRMETNICWSCRDGGANVLQCGTCDRRFHSMCLRSPAVSEDHIPEGRWECPCCFQTQAVQDSLSVTASGVGDGGQVGAIEEEEVERMGLTADWLISAAAFQVFKLPRPTAQRPYIPNLLDPCTNSKTAPNIPAQVLYDKNDDGLKLCNSWAGHYILLNPDYRAQVQWRFVNRAIDEVENGSVPAVVLVVRNSTDTAYFQRLRPYPRVMLRRSTAQFKDYSKAPPGFGIAVFCVAKLDKKELFSDFIRAFQPFGEPSLPFDLEFLNTDEFYKQMHRSREYAAKFLRDNWVQCSRCIKWRIVDFGAASAIGEQDDWNCSMLRPPYSSCGTPLTRSELVGGHYRARKEGEDPYGAGGDESLQPFNTTVTNDTTMLHQKEKCLLAGKQDETTNPNKKAMAVNIPSASVSRAISVTPLGPLKAAASRGPDAEVATALELARAARIAANRAYLEQIQATDTNNATGKGVQDALPCDHPAVLTAAREVARIAALQACAAQKETAQQSYEQARRIRQRDEKRLLDELKIIRDQENQARQLWEAARKASDEIRIELNNAVGSSVRDTDRVPLKKKKRKRNKIW